MLNKIEDMFNGQLGSMATENANKSSDTLPTQRDLLAGLVSKEFALTHILPKHIANAHTNGDIHFHDLDYSPFFPMFNCMLIDIEGMLTRGFKMGNAEIESPKSISTAAAITAQIIAQVASHIYGGNTIDRIDEVLAPYVRKSYEKHLEFMLQVTKGDTAAAAVYASQLVSKETYNAFQALEYEVNTLHTANGQTPFTTFGFGLGISWEARLIQECILKVRLKGLGKTKKTAVFPKLVFSIRDGVNHKPGDPNYKVKQLALECSARRMYPDILNYDKLVEVTGGFKAPMGCRSFLQEHEGQYAGRNNLGVVSLNIPRIAIESGGDTDEFFKLLVNRIGLALEALHVRVDRLRNVKAKVAPILYCEGACGVRLDPEDDIFQLFEKGRASVSLGYIGLHEAATQMFPEEQHTFDSKVKRDFCLKVVEVLKSATILESERTGLGFGVYSTPSESLCNRFCSLDKEKYGDSITAITDKGYYTNSFHLDVAKKVNPFEKINFEKDFPIHASSGFIVYAEFPNMQNNLKALEAVWDYTYHRVPYFGTNTPIDHCELCDFSGEAWPTVEGFACPYCGNKDGKTLSVIRRVCGYLGAPNARPFNPGKQQEVIRRVKHENSKG